MKYCNNLIRYSPLGDRGLFDDNGFGLLMRASDATAGVKFIHTLGLDPDTEALEVFKYENAVTFWLATAKDGPVVDLAYDGVILQRGMRANAIIANYTQADYIIMDYEDFGARENWIRNVHLSTNAEAKRLQGETNLSLAIRLGREFLENHTRSLLQYAPADVLLGVYDLWATGVSTLSFARFFTRLLILHSEDHGMQQFSWSDYASSYLYATQPSHYTNQQTIPFLSSRFRQEQAALPATAVSTPWFAMEQWAGAMPGDVWFAAFAHM